MPNLRAIGHDHPMHLAAIDWKHWADVATAFTPLGTLLLFGVTIYQAGRLRDQVKQGQTAIREAARAATAAEKAVGEAARAATATERAVREATRSRIEATAPHVVAFLSPLAWPPYLDRARKVDGYGRPQALDNTNAQPIREDVEFHFPEDANKILWFPVRITVRNEGQTTARVSLSTDPDLVLAEALTVDEYAQPGSLTQVGTWANSRTYMLPPDQTMYLEWSAGRRLAEWRLAKEEPAPPNPQGSVSVSISCGQDAADGILDTITFELAGRPICPDDRREGQWRLTDDPTQDVVAVVSDRVRRYKVDGELNPVGPSQMQQMYGAWEELAQKGERRRA